MILRELPAIADPAFRPWFYSHWGRENCVIAARSRDAQYPLYTQRLSIKAAWSGTEDYFVDNSRLRVNEETYLILNEGQTYGSSIRSKVPVTSFSIFFRPGMAQEVFATLQTGHERLMNGGATAAQVEFSEHLRPHDRLITPVLRFICRHAELGLSDDNWYEEQLYFLLQRMHALHEADTKRLKSIPALRTRTRRELFRRVGMACNFINSQYSQPITLEDIAAASHLSRFHFLRVFRSVYGVTPVTYLNRRRARAALRLLQTGRYPVEEVAILAGFQCRSTLFRQFKRIYGAAPTSDRIRSEVCPYSDGNSP